MANFNIDQFNQMIAKSGNEDLKASDTALKLMVNQEAKFQTDVLGIIQADLQSGKAVNNEKSINASISSIQSIIDSNRVNDRVKNVGKAAVRVLDDKKSKIDEKNKVLNEANSILNQINKIRKREKDAPKVSEVDDLVFGLTTTVLNKDFDESVEQDLKATIGVAQDYLSALQPVNLLNYDDSPNKEQLMRIKELQGAKSLYSSDPQAFKQKRDTIINQYISASDEAKSASLTNDDIANSIKSEQLRKLKFDYFKVKSDYGHSKGILGDDLIKLLGSENSFAEKDMQSVYFVPMIQERLGNVIAGSIPEEIRKIAKKEYGKRYIGASIRSIHNDRAFDPRYIAMLSELTFGEHGDSRLGLYGEKDNVPKKEDDHLSLKGIYRDRYKANQGSKDMGGGKRSFVFDMITGGGSPNYDINIWPRVRDTLRDAYSLYSQTEHLMPDEELLNLMNPTRRQLHTPQETDLDDIPDMGDSG